MMGSGKSTIGRLLAKATSWPYLDNDELLLRSQGATARELVAERGETAMREAEAGALAAGVEEPAPAIIGVAAGTILDEANRNLLRSTGIVVWLRADAAVLEARAMDADHRPWLDSHGPSWIRDAVAEREPLYASVADIVIDTGAQAADASTVEILAALARAAPCAAALDERGSA